MMAGREEWRELGERRIKSLASDKLIVVNGGGADPRRLESDQLIHLLDIHRQMIGRRRPSGHTLS
jgi:uncharacterized protein YfkK (UPF0435 family)